MTSEQYNDVVSATGMASLLVTDSYKAALLEQWEKTMIVALSRIYIPTTGGGVKTIVTA